MTSAIDDFFSPIDTLTAEAVGKVLCDPDEELLLVIKYLSAVFRLGHLFIDITDQEIIPHPHALIKIDEEALQCFCTSLQRGFAKLVLKHGECQHIVKNGNRLYLRRAWKLCQDIEFHFNRLQSSSDLHPLDHAKAKKHIEQCITDGVLYQEQAEAILEAIKKPLFCIWGGPGTGKTHTAGIFLRVLFQAVAPVSDLPFRVAIAAPTGKATNNLAKSIQRAFGSSSLQIDVKTLHSLLQIRQAGKRRGKEPGGLLPYSLMIVDESSMIDASLCAKLLSRLADGSRVLFLGDPAQLPPVEPGCPFTSFVQEQGVHQGRLSTSRRTDLQPILELAKLVTTGDAEGVIDFLGKHQKGVSYCPFDEKLLTSRLSEYTATLYSGFKASGAYDEQFSHLLKRQILSPLKVGAFGTQEINAQVQNEAILYAKRRSLFCFEPLVITKNDYQLNLSNGQIGIATDGDRVIFESSDTEGMSHRAIPRVLLASYEQAYCLSVHKSQGSEFDFVLLILPPGSESFGRKMLYTAITRAKKAIEIWASEETIRACVRSE